MLRQLIKRLLQRTIRAGIRTPLMALIFVVPLVALAVWLISAVSSPSLNLALPSTKGEPGATERYLKGNQTYNAELMWNSLSEEAIERFRTRGGTMQDMQRQLEAARERGSKLEDISYIGGRSLPDGTSLQFYVVATRGPTSRADVEYVTYIFTLDRTGKIAKVQ
jgi:hypothetical protein